MSRLHRVLVSTALAISLASNADADRRVNDLALATELRHGCQSPRRPAPLTVEAAKSKRNHADADAPPHPLAEVIETGHECWRKPSDSDTPAHHRRLIENRFEVTPLFESTTPKSEP